MMITTTTTTTGDTGVQLMVEELFSGLYLDTRFKSGKEVEKVPDLQVKETHYYWY